MNEQSERVLIVDDDQNLLLMLSRILKKSGYEIQTASDGLQGLQLLQTSSPFAVLLTDLMMPEMDGMELLRRAREMDPYLEIIVITAAGSIESAIVAMRDGGAYDYLLKPFESVVELSMVVGRAVAHRRLVMERAALQQQAETDAMRLQSLVTNVGEAILAASADDIITVANPSAVRLIGREDLAGNYAQDVLPPKLANIVENWRTIVDGYPASLEIYWQDDSIQMVSLTPLLDRSDNWQGWAMVIRDITSLKQLDQLKTQALADAVNKIRLPLAEAMSAVVDLNLRAAQDENLADSLFQLTKVWEHIKTWGDEVLAVVQVDSDRRIRPKEVDPNQVLEEIQTDRTVTLYKQGGGKLDVRVAGSLPLVHTDPQMLTHLLQSLIKRATTRSPQDGQIRILAREYKGQVCIAISDDGPSAGDTDLLSVADLASGLSKVGLELVRAKSILDRLDGQLWIGGQGPMGSTIFICLPAIVPLAGHEGQSG